MIFDSLNVPVIIKSLRNINGEPEEEIYYADGKIHERNSSRYILYTEGESTGMNGVRVKVKTDGTTVSITRFGEVSTVMEYVTNEVTTTTYRLPFGMFNLEIDTKGIVFEETDHTYSIKIHYNLDMGGQLSENRIEIVVKESENQFFI